MDPWLPHVAAQVENSDHHLQTHTTEEGISLVDVLLWDDQDNLGRIRKVSTG